ncbi:MAG: precorrin-3B synthase [Pseudorhodobacter sp.]
MTDKPPVIMGWCPGALRPMRSGDGLVVRIRPHAGRISPEQAAAIADAAGRHGNGLIDLSARANLQIRGVTEASHSALMNELAPFGLLDPDLVTETRRNITISPFAEADDLAGALENALAAAPVLPGKFGFVLDPGPRRWLARTPGDIRIEGGVGGGLILRADGAATGRLVSRDEAPQAALALARWFATSGGVKAGRGRMAAHLARGARLPATLSGDIKPAPVEPTPGPGLGPEGALVGFAFGQMAAQTFSRLARTGHGLRITPWRMILIEGAADFPDIPGLVTDPLDPILKVVACSGAPDCLQAFAPTRPLARALAPVLAPHLGKDGLLHVSGCAKGCAHPREAALTLTATSGGFDLVRNGRAADPGRPCHPDDLPALLTGAP